MYPLQDVAIGKAVLIVVDNPCVPL